MPNIKSAEKRMRQNVKRRAANRIARSTVRTSIKKVRGAMGEEDVAAAQAQMPQTLSVIDKAARKGIIHKNKAARQASRLMKAMNGMAQKKAAS